MTEWNQVQLDTVAELSGGYAFKSDEYAPSGRFVLRTLNITDGGRISRHNAVFIPISACDSYERFELQEHDTLFVMVGATLGKVGYVSKRDLPALLNQNMWRIRAQKGAINQTFLHYAFRSIASSGLAGASGSARSFVKRDDYRRLKIPFPPAKHQDAIALLLGSLDEKIELNRQMNETLEEMARSIFRDWFVDFGPVRAKVEGRQPPGLAPDLAVLFPGALDDEDKPKGWQSRPLDTLATFLNGLALQKYPATGNGYLAAIKIAELRSGITANSDKVSADLPTAYIVNNGDILFAWSGSLTHLIWTGGRGALNQHLFKVTSDVFPKWFYFFWIGQHMPTFQAIAASKATTMGHIQRHHLTEAITIVPDRLVLEAADKLIAPLLDRMVANDLERRTLAALRDLLLPKLMSGEVRTPDAEKASVSVA